MKISYECDDLIADIKEDIQEFGEDEIAYGIWIRQKVRVPFTQDEVETELLVNYLIGSEQPAEDELEGGRAEIHTLKELLEMFEEQNEII